MNSKILFLGTVMMLPTFASCQQEKPFPDDAVDKVYEYLPEWQAGYLDIHQISTGRGNAAYLIFPDGTTMLLDAGDLGVHTGTQEIMKAVPNDSKRPAEWIAQYIKHFSLPLKNNGAIDYALLTHFDTVFFKNKEFKFIALRSFAVQVASGTAAVIAALNGAGLYALIISPILSSILLFIISLKRYPQHPAMTLGWGALRKIFSYSAYQFLFNVINYFSRNLDKLLIGKYMGMSELGYYEKSYRLMMLPLQNITQVVTPVMHPIFSDYQNDLNRLASAYERILRLLAFIGIPLSVLLFFTAEEVTLIIFGQQWLPSVPVFRILTLSVGVQIILSSSGSIFQAAGDTRSLFVCGVFSSVLNVTGMLLGIFWFGTLEAVAWCIVTTFCINFIQCYWQMYRVTLRRSMWTLLRQFTSPIIAGMLIAAALIPLHYLTNNGNIFLTFILKSIVSFTIFGIYIQITREYDLMGKIQKIAHKRKK